MNNNELNFDMIKRVGIDKLELSGFAVADIDIRKLVSNDMVEVVQATDPLKHYKRHMPESGIGISKIIITDNEIFSDMIIGCRHNSNNIPIEYVFLTICVSNAKGCNLENMSYSEYDNYISCVIEYINSKYGITLHTDYMKVDYIEINANILLEHGFNKYRRALKLLMSFFHNHLGKLSTYENMKNKGAQAESYKRGNNSTEIIFYNKTQQLIDSGNSVEVHEPILRIELRLKNRKKVDNAFHSCFWKDLSQEKINGYFKKQIYEQLLKKFNNWEKTREKELKKLILACRTKSSKNWHHILMQEIRNKSESEMIPYILDIEQVCSAYKVSA